MGVIYQAMILFGSAKSRMMLACNDAGERPYRAWQGCYLARVSVDGASKCSHRGFLPGVPECWGHAAQPDDSTQQTNNLLLNRSNILGQNQGQDSSRKIERVLISDFLSDFTWREECLNIKTFFILCFPKNKIKIKY